MGREPFGEFDGRRRRVRPEWEEGEILRLLGGGLCQFLATVTHLHDEESGERVEVAASLIVEDAHALAAGDHRRSDGVTVPGEMSPEVRRAALAERLGGVGWCRGCGQCHRDFQSVIWFPSCIAV